MVCVVSLAGLAALGVVIVWANAPNTVAATNTKLSAGVINFLFIVLDFWFRMSITVGSVMHYFSTSFFYVLFHKTLLKNKFGDKRCIIMMKVNVR